MQLLGQYAEDRIANPGWQCMMLFLSQVKQIENLEWRTGIRMCQIQAFGGLVQFQPSEAKALWVTKGPQ